MSLLGYLMGRKKKQNKNETLAGGAFSADADKVLRQIKGEGKQPEKKPEQKRPADPNVPVENIGSLASELLEIEKKRKKTLLTGKGK